jgi:hypothetical protein
MENIQIEVSERMQIVGGIKRLPPWNAIQRMTPDQQQYYKQRHAYYVLLGTAIDDYFGGSGDSLAHYKGDHVQLVALDRDFWIAWYGVAQAAWHLITPYLPIGCEVSTPGQALYVAISLGAKAEMQVTDYFADFTPSRTRRLIEMVAQSNSTPSPKQDQIKQRIKSAVAVEYPNYKEAHLWPELLLRIARSAPQRDRTVHSRLRTLTASLEELLAHVNKMTHPQKTALPNRWEGRARLS